MKIGIIGMGFVGGATAKVLEKTHKVLPYDIYKEPYKDASVLKDAEVIFVCVPTPMKPDGEIDYSAIYNSVETIMQNAGEIKPLIVIRSTAVPGTTDMLEEKYPFNFASNPEFLREKHAIEDMENTDRIVIGANRLEDYKKVGDVYKPLFPQATYIHVDGKTAEMIKYTSNIMLIGQIGLANEIYQICKTLRIKYDEVKKAILLDKRIARNINVPGPDGDFGFGGKCFPKDLKAITFLSEKEGYDSKLFKEIWDLNERIRKNKDWLNIPGATSENQNFEQKSEK